MISVVIPTWNADKGLARTLEALVPGALSGLVRQVIVADAGSKDLTLDIAEDGGADIVHCLPGRGQQLIEGAKAARHPWLLFLHADTELAPAWTTCAADFIAAVSTGRRPVAAGAFRFRLHDQGWRPRLIENAVAMRCRVFKLPFGDQGLLISRSLYDRVGGFAPLPLMEDLDLVRRLGAARIALLDCDATTDARRYQEDGYLRRALRNQACLAMYLAGVSTERIARIYEGGPSTMPQPGLTRARGKL